MPDSNPPAVLFASTVKAQNTSAETVRCTARRANRFEARSLAQDPLLNAREVAAETGRTVSTFWRDVKQGRLPAPYYVTIRALRWRLSELQAAIESAPRTPTINHAFAVISPPRTADASKKRDTDDER